MTKEEQIKFKEKRRRYIGGSDAPSLVGVGDWACELKLFNDKVGVTPDFDDSDRAEFMRGHRLEQVAAEFYSEKTGRMLQKVETKKVPGKPYLAVNLDRLVYDDVKGAGYLEIKVVGRETYYKIKKEGIHDAYIIQVQWGMAITGLKWGAFAIYWPDGDQLIHMDFEANPTLQAKLLEKGEDFWLLNVQNEIPPNPLPVGSKACKSCVYRIGCSRADSDPAEGEKGVVERADLAALALDLKETRAYKKEIGDRETEIKNELIEAIKETPGLYRFAKGEPLLKYSETTSERFDSTGFKKANPELAAKFTKPSKTKKLAFAGKEEEE